MLVLSRKSKEEVFRVGDVTPKWNEDRPKSFSFSNNFNMSLDFGDDCLVINDISEFINESIFDDKGPGFREYELLKLFHIFNKDNDIIKIYEISDNGVNSLSELDLLNSSNKEKFELGCLIKLNLLYNLKYDPSDENELADKLGLNGEDDINSYCLENERQLKEVILAKDNDGITSFMASMLLDDNDEVFYKNALRLDKTGKLAHLYMSHASEFLEDAVKAILRVDNDGLYIIDSLIWANRAPIDLANKITQLNNLFAVLTFKNRYVEYLENCSGVDVYKEFVSNSDEIIGTLDNAICNFDFDNAISMDKMLNNCPLEQTLRGAISDIINILISHEKYSTIEKFINFINEHSKSKSNIDKDVHIEKECVDKVLRYNLKNDSIVIIYLIDGFYYGTIKSNEDYTKLCESLAWNNDIELTLELLLS